MGPSQQKLGEKCGLVPVVHRRDGSAWRRHYTLAALMVEQARTDTSEQSRSLLRPSSCNNRSNHGSLRGAAGIRPGTSCHAGAE